MKRHASHRLSAWNASADRKPLIVRGARQVGKSTLVRLFAEASGLVLHEVNLERHSRLGDVFATLDTRRILTEIEFAADCGPVRDSTSILFLDEIQAVPEAIPALRALYEDRPKLPVIAAGSLLEFVLSEHRFSMPVGRVEYLFVEPMGFEEFLEAVGEDSLLELLRRFDWSEAFPTTAHDRLVARLRDYLLVGGMPEAVARFAATASIGEASRAHASILETYRDDFPKYGTAAEIRRLRRAYDSIPGAIGEKVKYSRVDPDSQSRDVKRALEQLVMARLVRRVTHSDAVAPPLGATLKENAFKVYFLDVGLVNAACGVSRLDPETVATARFVNEGPMAEQYVAQHLAVMAPDDRTFVSTYWLREGRANNAEVDFLVQIESDILPVEVKAGKSGSLKSLHELVHLRDWPRAVRLDTSLPSRSMVSHTRTRAGDGGKTEFELVSLPLYLIEQLPRLLPSPSG